MVSIFQQGEGTMKKTIIFATATLLMTAAFTIPNAEAGPEGACKACHNFSGEHKMGPGLAGIFGREAGSSDFAKYSTSMKKGGWVWSEENLRTFLSNTKEGIKTLSGDDSATSSMKYKVKAEKMDAVIEFLKGLK
jgi:cytochrome c2